MKYDPETHITHPELAALMGVKPSKLQAMVRHREGPRSTVLTVNGESRSCYVRANALRWAESLMDPKPASRGERVPPPAIRPLHAQGVYRPSQQMSINQARAAELYPHRLYTPVGIGNGIEHSRATSGRFE